MKILFICKQRVSYGVSYGLINSARFVAEALTRFGIEAKVISVVDNNCIDRAVTEFKPDIVIIEALWVVPSKFPVLVKLHPTVKWVVRLHSKSDFIANEGIAMDWIAQYVKTPGVQVSANNKELADSLAKIFDVEIPYSPNIYEGSYVISNPSQECGEIRIGCFGAIRPLKNHLTQAMAAIAYAKKHGKVLKFYINSDRVEQKGEEPLKNLRALFAATPNATLCELPWVNHEDFMKVVASMDLVMQVTLSETFNIVSADAVANGVPVLVCPDVEWAPLLCMANPMSLRSIERGITRVLALKYILVRWARLTLKWWNQRAIKQWLRITKI